MTAENGTENLKWGNEKTIKRLNLNDDEFFNNGKIQIHSFIENFEAIDKSKWLDKSNTSKTLLRMIYDENLEITIYPNEKGKDLLGKQAPWEPIESSHKMNFRNFIQIFKGNVSAISMDCTLSYDDTDIKKLIDSTQGEVSSLN